MFRTAALTLALMAGSAMADPLLEVRGAHGGMTFDVGDIFGVALTPDMGGYPAIDVRLRPEVTAAFADLTSRHMDKPLDILFCGKLIMSPVIRSVITRGQFVVSGPPAEAAAAYVPILRGEAPCPEQD